MPRKRSVARLSTKWKRVKRVRGVKRVTGYRYLQANRGRYLAVTSRGLVHYDDDIIGITHLSPSLQIVYYFYCKDIKFTKKQLIQQEFQVVVFNRSRSVLLIDTGTEPFTRESDAHLADFSVQIAQTSVKR